MVDFEEAIRVGLGFKIDLTPIQASRGFDKIIALGVKMSTDVEQSRLLAEELIAHHKSSRKGFSLLPQGTPTNNTEKEGAGHKSVDDPDISFDNIKKGKLFDLETDWMLKKDGQWLAESLGIDASILQDVMYGDGTDQQEARAMNTALWPATMGYMMETMMQPVFSDSDVESTRAFFNNLVLGQGRPARCEDRQATLWHLCNHCFFKNRMDQAIGSCALQKRQFSWKLPSLSFEIIPCAFPD